MVNRYSLRPYRRLKHCLVCRYFNDMFKCQYEVAKTHCGSDVARVYVTFQKFSLSLFTADKCTVGELKYKYFADNCTVVGVHSLRMTLF